MVPQHQGSSMLQRARSQVSDKLVQTKLL